MTHIELTSDPNLISFHPGFSFLVDRRSLLLIDELWEMMDGRW
jgi:hypothetical protein